MAAEKKLCEMGQHELNQRKIELMQEILKLQEKIKEVDMELRRRRK